MSEVQSISSDKNNVSAPVKNETTDDVENGDNETSIIKVKYALNKVKNI